MSPDPIRIPAEVMAEVKAKPGRQVRFEDQVVWSVIADEGPRRGRPSGIQVEHRDGKMDAHVVCDGIRETLHLSDYIASAAEREELKRLLTRGRPRRVAGPLPHQVASGLFVPKG